MIRQLSISDICNLKADLEDAIRVKKNLYHGAECYNDVFLRELNLLQDQLDTVQAII